MGLQLPGTGTLREGSTGEWQLTPHPPPRCTGRDGDGNGLYRAADATGLPAPSRHVGRGTTQPPETAPLGGVWEDALGGSELQPRTPCPGFRGDCDRYEPPPHRCALPAALGWGGWRSCGVGAAGGQDTVPLFRPPSDGGGRMGTGSRCAPRPPGSGVSPGGGRGGGARPAAAPVPPVTPPPPPAPPSTPGPARYRTAPGGTGQEEGSGVAGGVRGGDGGWKRGRG